MVYGIKDMYKAGLSKGVVLKLLHGRPPSKSCGFTKILKVCDLVKDHTVIGCTVSENKRLLEQTGGGLQFHPPIYKLDNGATSSLQVSCGL
jgi:hypothetical protein